MKNLILSLSLVFVLSLSGAASETAPSVEANTPAPSAEANSPTPSVAAPAATPKAQEASVTKPKDVVVAELKELEKAVNERIASKIEKDKKLTSTENDELVTYCTALEKNIISLPAAEKTKFSNLITNAINNDAIDTFTMVQCFNQM